MYQTAKLPQVWNQTLTYPRRTWIEQFSNERRKTSTKEITRAIETGEKRAVNSKNSSHFPVTSSKRGKNRAYKARLALVLSLVKKTGTRFLGQLEIVTIATAKLLFTVILKTTPMWVWIIMKSIATSEHFSNGNLKFNALCCFPCTFVLSQYINSLAFLTNASVFNSSTDDLISCVLPPKLNCRRTESNLGGGD